MCEAGAADEDILVGIGKPLAVGRADFIDRAVIVGAKKGTGGGLDNIVAVGIEAKIALDKFTFF